MPKPALFWLLGFGHPPVVHIPCISVACLCRGMNKSEYCGKMRTNGGLRRAGSALHPQGTSSLDPLLGVVVVYSFAGVTAHDRCAATQSCGSPCRSCAPAVTGTAEHGCASLEYGHEILCSLSRGLWLGSVSFAHGVLASPGVLFSFLPHGVGTHLRWDALITTAVGSGRAS